MASKKPKAKTKASARLDWAVDEIYVVADGEDTYWGTHKPEVVPDELGDGYILARYKFDRMVRIEQVAKVIDA